MVGPLGPQLEEMEKNSSFPNLLFYGPSGSGKNTGVEIFLRNVYGKEFSLKTKFLNAADERGIEMVRTKIKEWAQQTTSSLEGHPRVPGLPYVIVLDEADNLTHAAQQALRRVMEQYQKSSRFFILCNQLSRITFPLQSRVKRFHCIPLSSRQTQLPLKRIIEVENRRDRKVSDEEFFQIAEFSNGDIRMAINLLQLYVTCPVSLSFLIGDMTSSLWESFLSPLSLLDRFALAKHLYQTQVHFTYLLRKVKQHIIVEKKEETVATFLLQLSELEEDAVIHKMPPLLLLQTLIFLYQEHFFVLPLL
jgi:DNA polymerase III delta prime subunit